MNIIFILCSSRQPLDQNPNRMDVESKKPMISLKQKYAEFAERNNNSVGMNEVIVPCIITKISLDVPSGKNAKRTYNRVMAITLNRRNVEMAVKTENEGSERKTHSLAQHSLISFITFDKTALVKLKTPCVCKVYLRADEWEGRISMKGGSIKQDANSYVFDSVFFNRYVRNGPLGEIPTIKNINPRDFLDGTDPKFMYRNFILPMTTDEKSWTAVVPLVDFNDQRRLVGKNKDSDELVPSVTMEVGPDKTLNMMNVMFSTATGDGTPDYTYVMKFGFLPSIWKCFGISTVERWTACAGMLISNAKGWFVIGSSNLDSLNRLCSNAETDAGYTVNGEPTEPDESSNNNVVGSSSFVNHMTLDLPSTIVSCGRELPKSWVHEKYSVKNYKFQSKSGHENELNTNCHNRVIESSGRSVYNVTEMDDLIRREFMENANTIETIKYYGIFAVGVDGPHEAKDIAEYLADKNHAMPSTVFAIVTK